MRERWSYPEDEPRYEIVELTPVRSMPFSKGLEVNVLSDGEPDPDLRAGLHQYLYNVGVEASHAAVAARTASSTTRRSSPATRPTSSRASQHAYRGSGGKVLVLRIGGRITGDGQMELSRILATGPTTWPAWLARPSSGTTRRGVGTITS